jgi:hypothetical protein
MASTATSQSRAHTPATKPQPFGFLNMPSLDDLGRVGAGVVDTLRKQVHLPDSIDLYSDWVRSTARPAVPVQRRTKAVPAPQAKAAVRRKEPTFLEDLGQGFAEPWTAFTEQAGRVVDRRVKHIREGDLGGIASDIARSGVDANLTGLYGLGVVGSPLSATVKATSWPVNNLSMTMGMNFVRSRGLLPGDT